MKLQKYSKQLLSLVLGLVLLLSPVMLQHVCAAASNTGKAYHWYVKRNNEHKQPLADRQQAFFEKYDAYYIDKKHGDTAEDKVIYLTFDAGYENGNVVKILDVLRKEEVPAAFFVLKNILLNERSLVERMINEGHLVCNHTKNHKDMSCSSREEFSAELNGLADIYREQTGKDMPRYYRPPEGKYSEDNLKYAQELGYKTIFWSFAYADWDNDKQPSAEEAKKKIIDNMHNGAVLLLHPTSATNAAILGDLIQQWKAEGYRFGTLDELVAR
ncbi:MAG: polysaccharide deacetylase family protein [Clostridia bacterium]|nr:polysaccharide deacetylase family protein [Clostridia bacterium]